MANGKAFNFCEPCYVNTGPPLALSSDSSLATIFLFLVIVHSIPHYGSACRAVDHRYTASDPSMGHSGRRNESAGRESGVSTAETYVDRTGISGSSSFTAILFLEGSSRQRSGKL